jgi:hypothetical protein
VRVGTEVGAPAGPGYALRVDVGTAGLRIETAEDVLIDVRLALDESNRSGASFEEPQITVARDVDQSFDRATAATIVDEDRR